MVNNVICEFYSHQIHRVQKTYRRKENETKAKRSGAYSSGTTFGVHPYVLLNWTDMLNDVFTLAHEMGHNLMHECITFFLIFILPSRQKTELSLRACNAGWRENHKDNSSLPLFLRGNNEFQRCGNQWNTSIILFLNVNYNTGYAQFTACTALNPRIPKKGQVLCLPCTEEQRLFDFAGNHPVQGGSQLGAGQFIGSGGRIIEPGAINQ